jgi:hypothetical protein
MFLIPNGLDETIGQGSQDSSSSFPSRTNTSLGRLPRSRRPKSHDPLTACLASWGSPLLAAAIGIAAATTDTRRQGPLTESRHSSLTFLDGCCRSTVYLQVYGSARRLAHSFDAAGRIEWQSDPRSFRPGVARTSSPALAHRSERRLPQQTGMSQRLRLKG